MMGAPAIDYQHHPAFARLGIVPRSDDDRVTALVDEIDGLYEALAASPLPDMERQARFDRDIAPKLTTVLELTLARSVRPEFAPFVRAAMEDARKTLRASVTARSNREADANSDTAALPSSLVESLDGLRTEGICHFSPNGALARRVWRSTFVERALLRAKAARDSVNRCLQPLHGDSPAWRAIERHIRAAGFMDLASTYMGRPLTFAYMSLEYAHAAQSWYKDCYRDAGMETSDTVYMHFDADRDMVKIILYLQDVAIANGPFRYIPGSQVWRRSPVTTALQKGFDQRSGDFFDTNGADFTLGYYRPRFKLRQSREDMLSLPTRLRGSTHFGDDVINGSAQSHALLAAERPYAAPAGTMILFDGSMGVHRGGQVEEGARWVVNIGLLVNRNGCAATNRQGGMRGRLAYLKHTLGNVTHILGLR